SSLTVKICSTRRRLPSDTATQTSTREPWPNAFAGTKTGNSFKPYSTQAILPQTTTPSGIISGVRRCCNSLATGFMYSPVRSDTVCKPSICPTGYVNIPVGVGVYAGSKIAGFVYGHYGEKAVLALKYLATKTSFGQGHAWNGNVATLESALGVPRTEAMAKLQEVTGLDAVGATRLLWDNYHV